METTNQKNDFSAYSDIVPHNPARPMIVVLDKEGVSWLCDKGVDPGRDLKEQGCWQCGGSNMAFTRDD